MCFYSLGGVCFDARPASEQRAMMRMEREIIRKDIAGINFERFDLLFVRLHHAR